MKYLLDTDTCSYLMRQSSAVLMAQFDRIPSNAVAISVITQGELSTGLARRPLATNLRERFVRLNAAIPTLDMPAAAATHYASIRTHLEKRGLLIGANDLWIAAHALATGMTLVTNNLREFKRVPHLRVENWATQ